MGLFWGSRSVFYYLGDVKTIFKFPWPFCVFVFENLINKKSSWKKKWVSWWFSPDAGMNFCSLIVPVCQIRITVQRGTASSVSHPLVNASYMHGIFQQSAPALSQLLVQPFHTGIGRYSRVIAFTSSFFFFFLLHLKTLISSSGKNVDVRIIPPFYPACH